MEINKTFRSSNALQKLNFGCAVSLRILKIYSTIFSSAVDRCLKNNRSYPKPMIDLVKCKEVTAVLKFNVIFKNKRKDLKFK